MDISSPQLITKPHCTRNSTTKNSRKVTSNTRWHNVRPCTAASTRRGDRRASWPPCRRSPPRRRPGTPGDRPLHAPTSRCLPRTTDSLLILFCMPPDPRIACWFFKRSCRMLSHRDEKCVNSGAAMSLGDGIGKSGVYCPRLRVWIYWIELLDMPVHSIDIFVFVLYRLSAKAVG